MKKYEIIKNISVLTKRGLAQKFAIITEDDVSNKEYFERLIRSGSIIRVKESIDKINKKSIKEKTESNIVSDSERLNEKNNPMNGIS